MAMENPEGVTENNATPSELKNKNNLKPIILTPFQG
jgi:hypothetical protein